MKGSLLVKLHEGGLLRISLLSLLFFSPLSHSFFCCFRCTPSFLSILFQAISFTFAFLRPTLYWYPYGQNLEFIPPTTIASRFWWPNYFITMYIHTCIVYSYKMEEEDVTAKSLVFTKKAFLLLSVLLIAVHTTAKTAVSVQLRSKPLYCNFLPFKMYFFIHVCNFILQLVVCVTLGHVNMTNMQDSGTSPCWPLKALSSREPEAERCMQEEQSVLLLLSTIL